MSSEELSTVTHMYTCIYILYTCVHRQCEKHCKGGRRNLLSSTTLVELSASGNTIPCPHWADTETVHPYTHSPAACTEEAYTVHVHVLQAY